jgi:RNA polymerase sigma factor (sigma-70 family)
MALSDFGLQISLHPRRLKPSRVQDAALSDFENCERRFAKEASGNPVDSFGVLMKRISPTLQRITQKLNGHFTFMDHEDLFQEAALHLWTDFQRGSLNDKTDSYVLQGCYYHLKNYIRTVQDKAPLVSLSDVVDEEAVRLEEILEVDDVAAFEYVDGKMQVEALLDSGLTQRERDVLGLSMEGMTTREIGQKLGTSHVAVVKVRNRLKNRYEQLNGKAQTTGYQN